MEGRVGVRAVFPNEKHEFFTGWRAAQKGGPAGCIQGGLVGSTLRRASRLHIYIKLVCGKGQPGVLPFSAARRSVFCAAHRKFKFFIWKHGPPARPALQLVLSVA